MIRINCNGSINFDPIGKMLQKGKDVSPIISKAKELVEILAEYPHFRCIGVNSLQLNNAGAYIIRNWDMHWHGEMNT